MKTLLLTSLLFFTFNSQAAPDSEVLKKALESQDSCQTFVRYDDANMYLGFGTWFGAAPMFRVVPLNGSPAMDLHTDRAPVDLITVGQSAYALTASEIEEWDLTSGTRIAKYPTTEQQGPLAYQQDAKSFVRNGDQLIIAHGRLGLTFFDLKTKSLTGSLRLIPQQAPLESTATGIAVLGRKAYIVMDNFHLTDKIFRGVVIFDLDSQKVVAEMNGLDPGVTSVTVDANHLIASYGGIPIWKYEMNTIRGGNTLPKPLRRLFKFADKGHPVGHAAMDDKYYYTCFLKQPGVPGVPHSLVPIAIDRAATKL